MEHITFEIDNNKDLILLITIAEKLGIRKFFYTYKLKSKSTELSKLLKIIDKGVDVSNFGDISEWQRNTRADRNINLSNL
ncbi:MAG: hypothetical protein A2X08_04650 [Bacteroidetes bacterium GWA2_32_17]|nr:MAG: hypothetical protein A2X08_04650 [Bacteroidetes bacterium GWA2_32_17]